jgi:hypothetical protein
MVRRALEVSRTFLALALLLAPAARAQGAPPRAPAQVPHGESPPQRGHERPGTPREQWSRLDPAQRELLRRRYEEFRQMDEGQRREIVERWRRMRALQGRLDEALPEDVRRKLAELRPEERRAFLRRRLEESCAARGRALREKLPEPWRERLESADPQTRARMFQEYREKHRRESAARAIEHLGAELGLAPAEIERLESLPVEEQWTEVLELRRRQIREWVQREGLPAWVSAGEWAQWEALGARELIELWHARRRAAGAADPTRPPGDSGGRERRRRGERGLPGWLHELLRPDPGWHAELSALDEPARRSEIERRLRQRVLDGLEARPGLLEPSELERLRALEGREFIEALRAALQRGPRLEGEARDWPPPPGGR